MIDLDSILKAITIVLENEAAEKTVLSSLQSAGITALTTFLGAIVMGPVGIVAGATAGSVGTYIVKKNSFKPIAQVIREDLSPAQKRELAEHVNRAVNNFDITDAIMLMTLARNDALFIDTVTRTVQNYIQTRNVQLPNIQ